MHAPMLVSSSGCETDKPFKSALQIPFGNLPPRDHVLYVEYLSQGASRMVLTPRHAANPWQEMNPRFEPPLKHFL
ncbi:hypothetical protein VNO77_19139 [Canavalia gladiata]|uniref:Uncharacterized protein n=1 Tax=Canavalia gladiata TaxID=3824 RepID=A0AAN9LR08_CANGL